LVSLALFGKVVNAGDERVVVHDTERYPYNHIVMVGYDGDKDGDLGAYGSGALVGPHMILTAGHCVYSRNKGHYNKSDIYIVPGAYRGTSSSGAVETSLSVDVEAPYGFRMASRLRTNTKWQDASYSPKGDVDYGAIFVDCPFWDLTVYMPLGFDYEPSYLQMSGYPVEDLSDNSHLLDQWFGGGERLAVGDRQIYYDVYSSGGASGAPVWRSGDEMVVAVNRSHSTDWDPYPGIGARLVSQNEDLINEWLEWEPSSSDACPLGIVRLSTLEDVLEMLSSIRVEKELVVVSPKEWGVVDAPLETKERPARSVYQYFGGSLLNWKIYRVKGKRGDSAADVRYLVLQKPVAKPLKAKEAALLLTVSRTWKDAIPATQEATTIPSEAEFKAIEMPIEDNIWFGSDDTSVDD
jgi:V8-like Glu-specific endopeptidase